MGFFGKRPASQPKPSTLFGEKKHWARKDFLGRTTKESLKIGGRGFSGYERKKAMQELFPHQRFSTHISEREVKTRLRELRKQQTFAKTSSEKQKAAKLRSYLEKGTGLKGKY